MNLSSEQLAEILQRPGMRKANPALGTVAPKVYQPPPRPALERNLSGGSGREESLGVVVSIIAVRNKACDADNSRNGYKPLQDAIAQSLAIDDGSERIRFDYGQIQSAGPEGTIVRISWI